MLPDQAVGRPSRCRTASTLLSGRSRRYGHRRYQRAGPWDQFRVDIRVDIRVEIRGALGTRQYHFRHVRMIGSGRYN
jgi:hypothetical protein